VPDHAHALMDRLDRDGMVLGSGLCHGLFLSVEFEPS